MKRRIFPFALFTLLAIVFVSFSTASADGIIIPQPPVCEFEDCPPQPISQLAVRYHRVNVTIDDQLAITHVDQVFYNPTDWVIEGIYMFPLPLDATVTNFTLWIDGKPVP
ncbi:MAG: VIT domain-containing protein, partial [Anaerolineae bacterium]|nr:VIT domain-containing protein [Anaerolineae bacterium]